MPPKTPKTIEDLLHLPVAQADDEADAASAVHQQVAFFICIASRGRGLVCRRRLTKEGNVIIERARNWKRMEVATHAAVHEQGGSMWLPGWYECTPKLQAAAEFNTVIRDWITQMEAIRLIRNHGLTLSQSALASRINRAELDVLILEGQTYTVGRRQVRESQIRNEVLPDLRHHRRFR